MMVEEEHPSTVVAFLQAVASSKITRQILPGLVFYFLYLSLLSFDGKNWFPEGDLLLDDDSTIVVLDFQGAYISKWNDGT